MNWVMDFCAQSLRNIVIGLGGRMMAIPCSPLRITVSSELMAILSIVKDLPTCGSGFPNHRCL